VYFRPLFRLTVIDADCAIDLLCGFSQRDAVDIPGQAYDVLPV